MRGPGWSQIGARRLDHGSWPWFDEGADRYGGWALVVAYQDPNEPVRNLTVFDGYAVVQQSPASDQNVAVPVSGFLTPPTGQVRSRVGVVAYEGDLGLLGDSLRLNSTSLTNSLNPATNFFNSSLTGLNTTNTTGDPFQTNLMGLDVDTINANGVLANSATSATINLNTNNDTYFPGVVSFSTELFAPRLDANKSGLDINGGSLDVGDEVLYTIRVTNNGDDSAAGVVLSDVIPDGTTYRSGSLRIDGLPVTEQTGDDAGELAASPSRIIARLGTGANAANGGNLPIGATRTVSFVAIVGVVPVDETITNTATVDYRGGTSGLPLEGISNAVTLAPRPRSDLTVAKYGPTAPVTLPGTIDYRVIVVNRGPTTEPAAIVTDQLPAGVTPVAATSSQGSCALGATTVSCDLGGLDVGATAIIDITGTVASGSGTITNTASVAGSNLDLLPNNNTDSAVVTLNNPPVPIDQADSTPSATPVTVAVLAGATDPDGDSVSVDNAEPAGNGAVVVNIDGTVTYTPMPTFKGVDNFPFTVTDNQGGFGAATTTITVANAAPVPADDAAATLPGAPAVLSVLANDLDPNGDPLTVSAVTQPAGGAATGVVTDNGDGTVTFAPAAAFRGTGTFTYTVTDGTDSAIATVTVDVPDAAPVAVDDTAITPSATSVDIDVLANDLDDNGDPLLISTITQPAGGTAVGVATDIGGGTIRFAPAPAFKGIANFAYTNTDTFTSSNIATVRVTVLNGPPIAGDDPVTTPPATPIDIPVLDNDSDPNFDALTVIGVSTPSGGAASIDPVGVITYTPNPGFKGLDSFTYTISDGTDTSTATITVTVPNGPPVGGADRRTTESGTAITIPVLANDFDPNGDALSLVSNSLGVPSNGYATANPDGTITYTPNPGFKGLDSFVYTLTDGIDLRSGPDSTVRTITRRRQSHEPVRTSRRSPPSRCS